MIPLSILSKKLKYCSNAFGNTLGVFSKRSRIVKQNIVEPLKPNKNMATAFKPFWEVGEAKAEKKAWLSPKLKQSKENAKQSLG
jgi:hypothetical protein